MASLSCFFAGFFSRLSLWDLSRLNLLRNLIKRALEAGANFSIIANDINEAIIANAAGAKFIIADITLAKDLAKVAQNYLFDALIAVLIESEASLCELAKFEIDAAILPNAIKE